MGHFVVTNMANDTDLNSSDVSAAAALPSGWKMSGITALYVSPGEGRLLRANSKVVHLGRLTAVVRTKITGKNRRRVLEVVTTHCASA